MSAAVIRELLVERDLLMDVYRPTDESLEAPLPAVLLVHGGSYQIGGLRLPPYREAGAVHSSMEDWARLLSRLGYVCFVLDYRLIQREKRVQPADAGESPKISVGGMNGGAVPAGDGCDMGVGRQVPSRSCRL